MPEDLGGLCNLEVFILEGCELLQKLPSSMFKLSKLTKLSIRRAAIQELPKNLGQLDSLKEAWFIDCKRLCELLEDLGGLCNLESLSLDGYELLQSLPSSFSKLS